MCIDTGVYFENWKHTSSMCNLRLSHLYLNVQTAIVSVCCLCQAYLTLPDAFYVAFLKRLLFLDAGTMAVNSTVFGRMNLGFTGLHFYFTPPRTEKTFRGDTWYLIPLIFSLNFSPPPAEISLVLWPIRYLHVRFNNYLWQSQHGLLIHTWELKDMTVLGFITLNPVVEIRTNRNSDRWRSVQVMNFTLPQLVRTTEKGVTIGNSRVLKSG